MKVPSTRLIVTGVVVCLGAAALPFVKTVFAQAQKPAAAQPAVTEPSEKYFKNVKVLTGIPVDEFMGTMGLFSAALSYCCGDCHTGAGGDNPDWAGDKNPRKVIARQMAAMVKKINKEDFSGGQRVTCWTCHRGSPSPSITPSIDTIYGDPVQFPTDVILEAKTGQGALTLDQVFENYMKAVGPDDKLAAVKSYTAKGTSHLFGETREDPFEIYAKAPDMLTTMVHQRGGDLARVYNGRDGWVMLPLTVVQEYPLVGSTLQGGKLDAEMAFPWRMRQFFPNWKVGIPGTLDGTPVNIIQGSGPGILATFYFDKQTGMLKRMIRYVNSAAGRVPTQIDYLEYTDVDGVKMPSKWTFSWVSGREEYAATGYQMNAAVDNSKFNQPVQRAK